MGNLSISNIVSNISADATMGVQMTGDLQDHFGSLLSTVGNQISNTNTVAKSNADLGASTSGVKTSDVTSEAYDRESSKVVSKIDTREESSVDNDAVKEAVEEAVGEIKEAVKEQLGVTDEDIENAMATLGLTDMDLITDKGLAQLSTELLGVESPAELLMNEEFQNLLTDFSAIVSELTQTTGMDVQTIQQMLDFEMPKVDVQTPQVPDQQIVPGEQAQPVAQSDVTQETVEAEQSGQAPVESEEAVSNDPRITVEVQESRPVSNETKAQEPVVQEGEIAEEEVSPELQKAQASSEQSMNQGQTGEEADDGMDGAKLAEEELIVSDEGSQKDSLFANTVNAAAGSTQAQAGDAVTTAQASQAAPQTASYISAETAQSMISQVSQQVMIQISAEESTMELELNPASLGRLVISVTTRGNEVSAQLFAQDEAVKSALESQMATLRENLSEQGFKVQAVEVTVKEHAFDRNLEQQARDEQSRQQAQEEASAGTRRNILRGELDDLQGLMTDEEALIAKMMSENGNSMDLTA
ncbi:MAG: flagellar hook-length control protein FliK [Eubacterium sp.]|nr:flagellar hook-length control protein FliK [Eubacterium sp.]